MKKSNKQTSELTMNLQKFYFTFGTDKGFPFQGGWVIVNAPNMVAAKKIFCEYFPDKYDKVLNCSFVYSEEAFKKTIMYRDGDNLGAGCHLVIGPYEARQN